MKRIKLFLILVLTFIFSINPVNAACESKELNQVRQDAYKVSVSSELMKEEMEKGTYDPPDGADHDTYVGYLKYFNVYINNISENIYIEVTDSISGNKKVYHNSDSNEGTIVIRDNNMTKLNTYTIDVYATNEECETAKIRTVTYVKPKYNEYYGLSACEYAPNYYLCREYIDFDITYSGEETINKIAQYSAELEKKEEEKQQEIIKKKERNNKIIIASIAVVIVAGVATTIVIILKKRRVANEKD